METRRALLVDAFAAEPLAGNPAGVVPDAAGLTDEQCQAIARELGASETAFVFPSETADRRLRYFTPTTEVDLCGHATIAAHAQRHEAGDIDAGSHTLETNAGVLDVEVESGGRVWMTQGDPTVAMVDIDREEVAAALGLEPVALEVEELPLAVASTGLPFLVVPVRLLEQLGDATPDMDAVEELADAVDAVGIYAFTFDTLEAASTAHGRMWAPGAGVPEDPVTGTASGAVGAYLRDVDAFDTVPDPMRFEQGHFVDRPGTVLVSVGTSVRVGGHAVTALDGSLVVPEPAADEIIEG